MSPNEPASPVPVLSSQTRGRAIVQALPLAVPLLLVLVLGLAVFMPTLAVPRHLDDHLQQAWLHGEAATRREPWDLYSWVKRGEVEAQIVNGHIPWWTDRDLYIQLFRPLSSLLLAFDHAVLADRLLSSRLHSFAWWVALTVATWCFLDVVMPRRRLVMATLALATSPTLIIPIAWLADRNVLTGSALMMAAWAVAARASCSPSRRRLLVLAAALAGTAGCAGEFAWCLVTVPAAMLASRGRVSHRRTAEAVGAVVGALTAILLVARALGCGIHRSGIYVDPLQTPMEFLRQLPLRMVLNLSLLPSVTLIHVLPSGVRADVVGLLGLCCFSLALLLTVMVSGGRLSRLLLLIASLGALVPVLSATPDLRLQFGYHLGLIALLSSPLSRHPLMDAARWATPLARVPLLLLLLGASVHTVIEARTLPMTRRPTVTPLAALNLDGATHALLISTSSFDVLQHPEVVRRSGTTPARWLVACAAREPVLLQRTSASTLVLRTVREPLLHPADLYRTASATFSEGERFDMRGVVITVLAVRQGRPMSIRIEFPSDYDELGWVLLEARGLRLLRVRRLPVGVATYVSPG